MDDLARDGFEDEEEESPNLPLSDCGITEQECLRSADEEIEERSLERSAICDLSPDCSGSSSVISSVDSYHDISIDRNRFNIFNIAVTNARSVHAKIPSVIENFNNLDLDIMTISETWINNRGVAKKIEDSLMESQLKIIRKDRGSRGGGVGVVFNSNVFHMKSAFPFPKDIEAVCAVGRHILSNEKFVVVSAYIPPKTDAAGLLRFKVIMREKLEQIKASCGEYKFLLGADVNRRDISDVFESFPNIKQIQLGPSRGQAHLDVCFSNLAEQVRHSMVVAPLEDCEGNKSDHHIVVAKAAVEKFHKFVKKKFTSIKYTEEGEARFGELLGGTDWGFLDDAHPDEAVDKFDNLLSNYVNVCFKPITHTIKSTDKPWVTRRIRRLLRRKKRSFKRNGKSNDWRNRRDYADDEILLNKKRFFEKVKGNAVKLLQTEEAPNPWSISSLFPGDSDDVIADKAAAFFNKISNEFQPVEPPDKFDYSDAAPSREAIVKKIKDMKKPSSKVKGDIDRRLVIKHAPLLAVPLEKIYRSVFREIAWPSSWKNETVTLIPKTKAPESLSQLRNISCTAFFSKVLESFLLDSLKSEITLSDSQYGGKRGQGVDHMLIEVWDEIYRALEEGDTAAAITAVDFEKAFNRMDHFECLSALLELGGCHETIALVNAFLHGRKMSVKVNDSMSTPLPASGGAPQGSILGPFLFCAFINVLLHLKPDEREATPELGDAVLLTNDRPVLEDEAGRSESEVTDGEEEEERLAFFRWFKPRVINDTDPSILAEQSALNQFLDRDSWRKSTPTIKGYIDDFNVIERVRVSGAVSHITTAKTTTRLHAPGTQEVFVKLNHVADEKNMKVNPSKTQLLCISPATSSSSTSYINFRGDRLVSGESLKILGFNFDGRPGVALHVSIMVGKVRGRFWTMRYLKRSGLSENDLVNIYRIYLRPILDFAVPTYHPQLTLEMASEIERVQADVMRIIYGKFVSYQTVLENGIVEEHRLRREKIVKKFAAKAWANPIFKEKWFPRKHTIEYNIRNRAPINENGSRTERYRKSPLQHMRRLLNTNNVVELVTV